MKHRIARHHLNSKESHHYCVLLAGGVGSRFWPLSKQCRPKQFIDVLGIGKTFIRLTFERLLPLFAPEKFFIMTAEAYREEVQRQLPELKPEQILTEPARRNTAPCLAYAAYKIRALDPEAVLLVSPSDHYVSDEHAFRVCLARQMDYAARSEELLTIGIQPVFPAIGYGYIEVDGEQEIDVPMPVKRFKEKPALKEATEMLSSGRFLWNSGMFVWRADVFLQALEEHLPAIASLFSAVQSYNTASESADVAKAFLASPSISIDYGLMEKADNILVAAAAFGWSDLGTWESLYRQLHKDQEDNAVSALTEDVKLIDSEGVLLKSTSPHKKIIVEGLSGILIVDTADTLLICRRGDEAAMHKLLEEVEEHKNKERS